MKRAIIIVLDSVGIGALPDAHIFGDEGSNTLVNIKKHMPELTLTNLCALGLGEIEGDEISILGKVKNPMGCYGKMAEKSMGKDTTTGHWELSGVITKSPLPTFTDTGFPKEIMDAFCENTGRGYLGNYAASGTEIIQTLGDEHIKTGNPIVYTSADSVFQIAAHEDIIPLDELYTICKKARKLLTGKYGVGRVIARPFVGSSGNYIRTKNRKDFSLAPTDKTILDYAYEKGLTVTAVGKIEDIFANRGITRSYHTTNNAEGIKKTISLIKEESDGILFVNLVDYDMIYGHRNDIVGYGKALEYFDKKLELILSQLKKEDILFITADHGCDPTMPGTDHTREYVPLLVYGKNIKQNINLGCRSSFTDIAQTVSNYLNLTPLPQGESFLKQILYTDN